MLENKNETSLTPIDISSLSNTNTINSTISNENAEIMKMIKTLQYKLDV